jgi:hypothetical protein
MEKMIFDTNAHGVIHGLIQGGETIRYAKLPRL